MNEEVITYILISVSPNGKYVMIKSKDGSGKIEVISKDDFDTNYVYFEGIEYIKRPI